MLGEALATSGLLGKDIAALGIANQRETTVLWNRKTGRPVANALVWQDTRVADYVAELAKIGGQHRFRRKTGLPLSTYFSGLKARWILENVPGVREQAEAGDILFGTIDTFLVWHLTGGAAGGVHVTDVTNASRTQLMDLESLAWDRDLLGTFAVPTAMVPRIRFSAEVYGVVGQGPLEGVPTLSDKLASGRATPRTPTGRDAFC